MNVQEIRNRLDSADKAEATASQDRWEAAEGIVALLDAGSTQVDLAEKLDRSQTLVSHYARVWREKKIITQVIIDPTSFNEAHQWVKANSVKARKQPVPAQPTPEVIQPRESNALRHAPVVNAPEPGNEPEVRTEAEWKRDRAEIAEQLQPLKAMVDALPKAVRFPCFIGTLGELIDDFENDPPDPRFISLEEVHEAQELLGQLGEQLMRFEAALTTN